MGAHCFVVHVRCRRKGSSRSLSHRLYEFLVLIYQTKLLIQPYNLYRPICGNQIASYAQQLQMFFNEPVAPVGPRGPCNAESPTGPVAPVSPVAP